MKTIYINGVKATQEELYALNERVMKNSETIVEMYLDDAKNLIIQTI